MGILVVIPARAGSKRLPGKNLLDLAGKPMIAYTIDAALAFAAHAKIVVSTDSAEVAAVARSAGIAVPRLRPAELATDTATSLDVVRHELRECEREDRITYDPVVLLQPTSPLRSAKDIDDATGAFNDNGPPSLVSVCLADPKEDARYPDSWFVALDDKNRIVPRDNAQTSTLYRYNGAIYIYRRDYLLAATSSVTDGTLAYVMPRERSIDIDTKEDFEAAKAMLERAKPRK
ncbi:MAG: acylneuraminate cytidylyltransferase family protein [Planctomycetes bacterium]|nr:acylneuraminate cytidylyltransferase family protein [Planctomycetota bacterium]